MFVSLPPQHILKISMNAEIKTARLWDSTPTQVTLRLLPEIWHVSLRNHSGVSHFGASSVAFASVVTMVFVTVWPYSRLSVTAIQTSQKVQLYSSFFFLSAVKEFKTSILHQRIDASVVTERLLYVNGTVFVFPWQFSMTLQTQVFTPWPRWCRRCQVRNDNSTLLYSNNNPTP